MRIICPLGFMKPQSESRIALILLNMPLDNSLVKRLWKNSVFTAATDGACDQLLQSVGERADDFLPDLITGDFDSVQSDTLELYKQKGVKVLATPDQDETDFTKCLRAVIECTQQKQISCIVALGGFGGRIDHSLANINTLYTAADLTDKPVYSVCNTSVACLLEKGDHTLQCDTGFEGEWCGLIPVGRPADRVTTTGLKWNLESQRMCFGELISTSNSLTSPNVTVSTDQPLLWTMGYKIS